MVFTHLSVSSGAGGIQWLLSAVHIVEASPLAEALHLLAQAWIKSGRAKDYQLHSHII